MSALSAHVLGNWARVLLAAGVNFAFRALWVGKKTLDSDRELTQQTFREIVEGQCWCFYPAPLSDDQVWQVISEVLSPPA